MHFLLLLAACDPSDKADRNDVEVDDTARPDTDGTDSDTDTDTDSGGDSVGDSGGDDTGGEGDPSTGAHVWSGAFFDSPDLRITSCGSSDADLVVVEGPDLDGDGLPEVAIGSESADATAADQGRVYFFRGADLAAGADSLFSPFATVTVVDGAPGARFGRSLRWFDDLDGDGVPDLFVDGGSWFVSGADLLAGGDVAPSAASFFGTGSFPSAWDDVDGDGRVDWILADTSADVDSDRPAAGLVFVASGADLGPTGIAAPVASLGGDAAYDGFGATLAPLAIDLDGDGLRDLLVRGGGSVLVVGSASLLAGVDSASEAEVARITGLGSSVASVVVLGDVDGAGVEDLVFLADAGLCALHGEDLGSGDVPAACYTFAAPPDSLSAAGDIDGDGDLDVWVVEGTSVYALDATDLLAGTWTVVRTLPALDADVDGIEVGEGGVWLNVTRGGWTPSDAVWHYEDDGGLATTLTAGGWGGDPGAPAVRDLDNDGREDLIFQVGTGGPVYVVSGAQVAGGGEISLCDAAYQFTPSPSMFWYADDVTGDGFDEVVTTTAVDGVTTNRVLDGATLLTGGGEVELRSFGGGMFTDPGCHVLADGTTPLVSRQDTNIVLYNRAIVAGMDLDTARIGSIDAVRLGACTPDLDEDGLEDLLVEHGDTWAVVHANELAPDTLIDPGDAALELFAGESSTNVPLFFGTLGTQVTWAFLSNWTSLHWYVVPPLTLTRAEQLGAWHTAPDRSNKVLGGWLDHAVGGDEPDLVYVADDGAWNYGFYAVDGTNVSARTLLAPIVPAESDVLSWDAGEGPDVGDVGASSLWFRYSLESTHRSTLELLFAGVAE